MANLSNTSTRLEKQQSEDWVGFRHGKLLIVSFDGIRKFGRGRAAYFTFRCDCGAEFSSQKSNVLGRRFDCGCSRKKPEYTAPPSFTNHPLSKVWRNIHGRCGNPRDKSYKDYGARGISVCDRWTVGDGHLTGFECFIADMGERPPGYTIERDDANGNYEPSNCRWVSKSDQGKNTRRVRLITINGETKTLPDWCAIYGVAYFTANKRIKSGLAPLEALTRPVSR